MATWHMGSCCMKGKECPLIQAEKFSIALADLLQQGDIFLRVECLLHAIIKEAAHDKEDVYDLLSSETLKPIVDKYKLRDLILYMSIYHGKKNCVRKILTLSSLVDVSWLSAMTRSFCTLSSTLEILQNLELSEDEVKQFADLSEMISYCTGHEEGKPECLDIFMVACWRGQTDIIKMDEFHGVGLNNKTSKGDTAFSLALSCNHMKVAETLIKKGVNVQNEHKAMSDACQNSCIDHIRFLLKHGVDLSLPCSGEDVEPQTPLMVAARAGQLECLEMLIIEGADPNQICHGKTALMCAARGGSLECVKALLNHGASAQLSGPDAKSGTRESAMISMVEGLVGEKEKSEAEVVIEMPQELVAAGADVNHIGKQGSALCLAVRHGFVHVMTYLIDLGADMYKVDENGSSALAIAARFGQKECMVELLKLNVDVFHVDMAGVTPIEEVSKEGHSECLALLLGSLKLGEDHATKFQSAFELAVKYNHVECTELFLQNGTNPTLQDEKGETLVKMATRVGASDTLLSLLCFCEDPANEATGIILDAIREFISPDCLQVLLQAGADMEVTDEEKRTLLMLVVARGDFELTKVLLSSYARMDSLDANEMTALGHACRAGEVSCTKALIIAGADVNQSVKRENSPFVLAVREGQCKCVRVLVENGYFFKDFPEEAGEAMVRACLNTDNSTLIALIYCGADVNKGNENTTPLIAAASMGAIECQKLLLKYRAVTNSRDSSFKTALTHAVDNQDMDSFTLLIKHAFPQMETPVRLKLPSLYLPQAISDQSWRFARGLIDLGVDLDVNDRRGIPALGNLLFQSERDEDSLRLLAAMLSVGVDLSSSINVSLSTEGKNPPLYWAIRLGQTVHVQMLWIAGCNIPESYKNFGNNVRTLWWDKRNPNIHGPGTTEDDMIKLLRNLYSTPRSLLELSRLVFRKMLKSQIPAKVKGLELPRSLEKYLCLPDLSELPKPIRSESQNIEEDEESDEMIE